ncbi:branched-chain amino acid ABC transporter permease, partial [bacterium]|nr:branched-chain amino acid ABC transporter permease [bacterium]
MRNYILRNNVWIVMAVIMAILPFLLRSNVALSMLSQMGIAVIFALSYNMLLGQCGLLSFGHAVFFGLGGYFTIHALRLINNNQLTLPTPLLPLVGAFACMILGILIGLITTRRAGATFALITLGINELVASSALMFYDFFGSEMGVSATREGWLGFTFASQLEVYYLIIFWVFVCTILIYAFSNTPLGRISNAVRDNPERTEFIGYNPVMVRALVVMVSGFFAGLAGGLYAINWELVTYENVGIMQSAFVLFMVFIGGVRYFFGPILGAVLVTFLAFYLSAFTEAWLFYIGLFFVIMVLFAPSGIAGILISHKPLWKAKLLRRLIPSYIIALFPCLVMMISGIGLVEIFYRWSSTGYTKSVMTVFGVTFDVAGFLPWTITFAGLFFGAYFFIKSLSKVKKSWDQVSVET